ncbi:aldehyde dehydrogenase family protein [Mycolicibacterium helvum]|uniref:Aldehyde dehydrogenase n=1 Tax=Mycolicibacterium helvum TaxID=1534349 RepID=A0A7I7T9T4_9MYCO|nr:aldehyde dehydrogenase family protein [Mycolicibacterium helvum]BBY66014.1 aldehyde dehydrogenase [Mycolicibacterium helvum]
MAVTTSEIELTIQRDLIDGQWSAAECDLGADLTDPNSGQPLQRQRETAAHRVDHAIAAAAALHRAGTWRKAPAATRAAVLRRAAELLTEGSADIARCDAINTGVLLSVTTMFAAGLSDALLSAATHLERDPGDHDAAGTDAAVRLRFLPWGPAAVISPWNAPTFVTAKKTAFALAAGAPVIAKPSHWAPSGAVLFAEAMQRAIDEAGLPSATFQLVHGGAAIGQQLAADPRIRALSFTGGRVAGLAVARAGAADCKALQLELGSNNPAIVRADCDIDATADALVSGFTKLNGQWCESPGSIAVVARQHDALIDALLDRLREVRLGHCLDSTSTMGPQAHSAQYQHVTAAVDKLAAGGGTVHDVTARPDLPGWFAPPIVVDNAPTDLTVDEIFGPVLTVHRVSDDAEALELANSRSTGLAGYVFSTDLDAALELGAELDCGEVKVNGTSVLDLTPDSTQGFWGGSGIGAHGDAELLRFFRGARIVGVERAGLPI